MHTRGAYALAGATPVFSRNHLAHTLYVHGGVLGDGRDGGNGSHGHEDNSDTTYRVQHSPFDRVNAAADLLAGADVEDRGDEETEEGGGGGGGKKV